LSRIIISVAAVKGHQNPAIKYARRWVAAGHDVLFLGCPQEASYYQSQGMNFKAILEQELPDGFLLTIRNLKRNCPELRQILEKVASVLPNELEQEIRSYKADLFIVDVLLSWMALVPISLNVPVALFSSLLPLVKDKDVPSSFTRLAPARSLFQKFLIRFTWLTALSTQRNRFRRQGLYHLYHLLAASTGYNPQLLDPKMLFAYNLPVPMLIACPEILDFPRKSNPRLNYLEPSVDIKRAEKLFPWEKLDPSRKLVYCVMGSMPNRMGARILAMVLKAFESLSEYQLVLTTGNNIHAKGLLQQKSNNIVVEYAPQMAILEKASMIITHGGLNTLQDAIYYGVPMLVCPFKNDQPGNAARIRYHQLGVIVKPIGATPEKICRNMLALDKDKTIRNNVARMSQKFRELDRQAPSLTIVDSILRNYTLKP
jgi:MGT family glycosyltransferase